MTRRLFVTYGSHGNYWEAALRVSCQAISMNCFTEFFVFNDDMLRARSKSWRDWSSALADQDGPRYQQAAKAFLLEWIMDHEQDSNAVVFYCDPGCEFVSNSLTRKKMRALLTSACQTEGIAEQLAYPESQYTKIALLKKLDPEGIHRNSGQIQNTFFVILANERGLSFAKNWVQLINPEKKLWMDPDQSEFQHSNFLSHRRDQSIFSLLWKTFGYPVKAPYWEFGGKFGNIRGLAVPIHTIRNRSGQTLLPKYQNRAFIGLVGERINFIARFIRSSRLVIKYTKSSRNLI